MKIEKDIEKLWQLYFNYVYSFSVRLSGSKEVAEEVTQETFFRAIESIDQFKGKCKVEVWLCQVAKNIYFSKVKRNKRYVALDGREKMEEASLEELMVEKEQAFEIHKTLHELPQPYKEVFWLRIFGELSFDDINKLFGKKGSWASVTFCRAKTKIQRSIQKKEVNINE